MKLHRTIAAAALVALLSGCAPAPGEQPADADTADATWSFPEGAVADYQLGGAYAPAPAVELVVRDSTAEPAAGLYSVCYLNGFQTQPGEEWPADLLLRAGGEAVTDPAWPDESILDISTQEKRDRILDRLAPTITACATDGFEAIEFDNLDTYTRFPEHLQEQHAIAFATELAHLAHAAGLAAGQKNTSELAAVGRDVIGFDFAVAEECDRYEECDAYTSVYGERVVAIEYTDDLRREFTEICADPDRPSSMVLRDRDLVPPGIAEHRFEHC